MSHVETTLCDGCGKSCREGKSWTKFNELCVTASPALQDIGDSLTMDCERMRRLDLCRECFGKAERFLLEMKR